MNINAFFLLTFLLISIKKFQTLISLFLIEYIQNCVSSDAKHYKFELIIIFQIYVYHVYTNQTKLYTNSYLHKKSCHTNPFKWTYIQTVINTIKSVDLLLVRSSYC